MDLRTGIRSKRETQKGHAVQQSAWQDEESHPLGPHPHGHPTINDAIAEGIESFMPTIRPRPGRNWQLEILMFLTANDLPENIFDNHSWIARVSADVRSLPALMASGFHVMEKNVRRSNGHFILDDQRQNPFADQTTHTRSYTLKSTSYPKWGARVLATAATVRELSQFRMPMGLSAENVGAAVGFDKSGKQVYRFSAVNPDENFNAVSDDKPLDGWWPWPRSAPRSSKKAGRTSEALKKMRKEWKNLHEFTFGF